MDGVVMRFAATAEPGRRLRAASVSSTGRARSLPVDQPAPGLKTISTMIARSAAKLR